MKTKHHRKLVPASVSLQGKWTDFLEAISAAAAPFMRKPRLVLPVFHVYDLTGGLEEADAQLRSIRNGTVAHGYALVDGKLFHELTWSEDVR